MRNKMYSGSFIVNQDASETLVPLSDTLPSKDKSSSVFTKLRSEKLSIPDGTTIPPDLPRMFLDLLIPVKGLKSKRQPYNCSICGEELATWNSLVTHNKSHLEPACLTCGSVLPSSSKLAAHSVQCRKEDSIVVTSKYGRSRPVKSYLANLKL